MPTPRFLSGLDTVLHTAKHTVGRTIVTGVAGAVDAAADKITVEVVQEVTDGGMYIILGVAVTTRVSTQLRQGDFVYVQWRKGKPFMILDVRDKRGVGIDDEEEPTGPVEMLFIAVPFGQTAAEVYFRNEYQVTNLNLRSSMDGDPVCVKWAVRQDAFVVSTADHSYYICTIDREETVPIGDEEPSVTIVRVEKPLDADILLCTVTHSFALRGVTSYFDTTWDDDIGATVTLNAERALYITLDSVLAGQLKLSRVLIENSEGMITDVHLDDNLDLILSCVVNLNEPSLLVPSEPTISGERRVWLEDGSDTHLVGGDTQGNLALGVHAFIVNATKNTVLFRTAKTSVQSAVSALRHDYSLFWDSIHDGLSQHSLAIKADGPSLSFSNVRGGYQSAIESLTLNEVDESVAVYLDLLNQYTVEDIPFDTGATEGSTGAGTWGPWTAEFPLLGATSGIRVSGVNTGTVTQNTSFGFSTTYLPRRGGVLLGVALLKVVQVPVGAAPKAGFYMHDLDTSVVTPLVEMTPNYVAVETQGADIGLNDRYFSHLPETAGIFTVLGFNGAHLLWLYVHSATPNSESYVVEVFLTNVRGGPDPTKLVLAGTTQIVDGNIVFSDAVLKLLWAMPLPHSRVYPPDWWDLDPERTDLPDPTALLARRRFELLRPDFLYYPREPVAVDTDDEPDAEKGQRFIQAWDASTLSPTLDALAEGFPPVEPLLSDMPVLKELPSEVVPNKERIITHFLGPINVERSRTGPSIQVIRTSEAWGGLLTDDF